MKRIIRLIFAVNLAVFLAPHSQAIAQFRPLEGFQINKSKDIFCVDTIRNEDFWKHKILSGDTSGCYFYNKSWHVPDWLDDLEEEPNDEYRTLDIEFNYRGRNYSFGIAEVKGHRVFRTKVIIYAYAVKPLKIKATPIR